MTLKEAMLVIVTHSALERENAARVLTMLEKHSPAAQEIAERILTRVVYYEAHDGDIPSDIMAQLKELTPVPQGNRARTVRVRMTEEEAGNLSAMAERYTGGNVSQFIRVCVEYMARNGHLVKRWD